jgi:hypothetical protein
MTSRDKSLVAVVILLVIAVGGWFLLVQPKKSEAGRLQAEITSARSSLSQAQASVQTGLADEAEYKTYVKQLGSIQTAVPADDQIPQLINQLQAAADKAHVGFQEVSLTSSSTLTTGAAPTSSASTFPTESFSLQFTGRYFAVASLLGTLSGYVQADNEHFKATGRLLNMGSVSLAAGPKGFPGVTASVSAVDYDIPTALLGDTSTTASSTATATPAADITAK